MIADNPAAIAGILILIFLGPVLAGYFIDKRRRKKQPNTLAFGWGYYVAFMGLLPPFIIPGQLGNISDDAFRWTTIFLIFIFWPCSVFLFLRHRWAFIALTVLSSNPIVWIINGIYIRNRWQEMAGRGRLKSAEPAPLKISGSGDRLNELKALFTEGHISAEEYQAERARILKEI